MEINTNSKSKIRKNRICTRPGFYPLPVLPGLGGADEILFPVRTATPSNSKDLEFGVL